MNSFPFNKKIFLSILILVITANITYYNVRMNADHAFDPAMNLMLSLLGYLIFFPILVAFPALLGTLFMKKSIPLGSRFIRSFWVCILCLNCFLVVVMIFQTINKV